MTTQLDIAIEALKQIAEYSDAVHNAPRIANKALADIWSIAAQGEQQAVSPEVVAPWPDFLGQKIKHGCRLVHPSDGLEFTAVRLCGYDDECDAWRAIYDDAAVSRLCLQIGDKGQAVLSEKQESIGRIVEVQSKSKQALQDLATEAQELDMGYGKPVDAVDETMRKVSEAIASGTAVRMECDFDIVINGQECKAPFEMVCQPGFTYKLSEVEYQPDAMHIAALRKAEQFKAEAVDGTFKFSATPTYIKKHDDYINEEWRRACKEIIDRWVAPDMYRNAMTMLDLAYDAAKTKGNA